MSDILLDISYILQLNSPYQTFFRQHFLQFFVLFRRSNILYISIHLFRFRRHKLFYFHQYCLLILNTFPFLFHHVLDTFFVFFTSHVKSAQCFLNRWLTHAKHFRFRRRQNLSCSTVCLCLLAKLSAPGSRHGRIALPRPIATACSAYDRISFFVDHISRLNHFYACAFRLSDSLPYA
jgi:hypothetical protein